MRYIISLVFLLGLQLSLLGQARVEGKVVTRTGEDLTAIPGANIYWLGSTSGTVTDSDGFFEIPFASPGRLVISYVGFEPDTVSLEKPASILVTLQQSRVLDAVDVEGRSLSAFTSVLDPIHTVTLTEAEFRRAACCNLSEAFETTNLVDVSYTDAVTGAKQVSMLGLDGVYTQITAENLPYIRGLSSGYGIMFLPGTWMESLSISKNTGSVVNGFESMTGQINVELHEPDDTDKLFLNLFVNQMARTEANIHYAHTIGKHVNSIYMVHGSVDPIRFDMNGDGFMNRPLVNRFHGHNRWKFRFSDRWFGQASWAVLREDRLAGQMDFREISDLNQGIYGVKMDIERVELFAKTGVFITKDQKHSAAIMARGEAYDQYGWYGLRPYRGAQRSSYASAIYQGETISGNIGWKAGGSLQYDDIRESLDTLGYSRVEQVPGVFTEFTTKPSARITTVLGVRADHSNLFGWFITPKAHVKFDLPGETILRLTAGQGRRTPNPLADNPALMVSSRQIHLPEGLFQESLWNTGIGVVVPFRVRQRSATFHFDANRAWFTDQLIANVDRSPQHVYFEALVGKSYSSTIQVEMEYDWSRQWFTRLSYKFEDVWMTIDDELVMRPLTARHRVMLNGGFNSVDKKWTVDATLQIIGPKRLPVTSSNPEGLRFPETSPTYAVLNAQVTRRCGRWELYLGGENLTGFHQHRLIMAADDPFGPYFDASLVWGPMMRQVIYTGFRYTIPGKPKMDPSC